MHLSEGHPWRALPVILALWSPDFPHALPFGLRPRSFSPLAKLILPDAAGFVNLKSSCRILRPLMAAKLRKMAKSPVLFPVYPGKELSTNNLSILAGLNRPAPRCVSALWVSPIAGRKARLPPPPCPERFILRHNRSLHLLTVPYQSSCSRKFLIGNSFSLDQSNASAFAASPTLKLIYSSVTEKNVCNLALNSCGKSRSPLSVSSAHLHIPVDSGPQKAAGILNRARTVFRPLNAV